MATLLERGAWAAGGGGLAGAWKMLKLAGHGADARRLGALGALMALWLLPVPKSQLGGPTDEQRPSAVAEPPFLSLPYLTGLL